MTLTFDPAPPPQHHSISGSYIPFNTEGSEFSIFQILLEACLDLFNHKNVLTQLKSANNAVVKRHGLRLPPP